VITLSIFVFGTTDCTSNHLAYFFFSLPKPSNSNIVAREPISFLTMRMMSFKLTIILLIMGLFSFFSSAKAKDSSESPHLVQQAIDLSDKGDYEAGV